MATILLTIALVLLAILGLAVGVLAGRPPLKGSCGGLACSRLACGTCKRRSERDAR